MEGKNASYKYIDSFKRMDEILNAPAGAFTESDSLPSRDSLTFTNGVYANCTALFVDIRDSSSLPTTYTRPVLAKIYRTFISEVVAILNSDYMVREVNIVGDCVWAVYNAPLQANITAVLGLAAKVNSLIPVLNYKMKERDYEKPISVGIGIAYGRTLMIKAGQKGSTINDVIYMGEVVNEAANLAGLGNSNWQYKSIVVNEMVKINLPEDYQPWFTRVGWSGIWTGNVIDTDMDQWYDENCR